MGRRQKSPRRSAGLVPLASRPVERANRRGPADVAAVAPDDGGDVVVEDASDEPHWTGRSGYERVRVAKTQSVPPCFPVTFTP